MARRIIAKGSSTHRAWQVAGYGLLVVAFFWVLTLPDYRVGLFTKAVSYGVAVLGLNVVIGCSGQISLGHSAFMGLGAYTTAILMADHNWPFLATVVAAAVLGFTAGLLTGLPALRIRGLYLALVTMALAVAFPVFVKRFDSLTGGGNGKNIPVRWHAPDWFPLVDSTSKWKFVWICGIAAVVFALVSNFTRSRAGRALVAVRDNEVGAAVSGVHPARFKVLAFAISAAIGAVGGAMLAFDVGTISDNTFGFNRSIEMITGLLLGGIGTVSGGLVGGLVVEFLPYYSSNWLPGVRANILYGVVLLAVVYTMPGGIVWALRQLKDKFVRFLPMLPGAPTASVEDPPVTEGGSAAAAVGEQARGNA